MREQFPGYYRPTQTEFDRLWAEGWFVLDANILLNLYRYQEKAREEFLSVLTKLAPRLWVPHQAVLEYQRNRVNVIGEQLKKFRDVKKLVNFEALKQVLNPYNNEFRALIDPTQFLATVKPAFELFLKQIAEVERRQIMAESDVADDPVRAFLDELLPDRTGSPFTQTELDALYAEGEKRYHLATPPGYADPAKKGTYKYQYGGRTYRTEFGDWLLWRQILDWARENAVKNLVFVTDDRTDDWWQIVKEEGSPARTIGPRPELAAELRSESGVTLFYMYQSDRFLEQAKAVLNISVSSSSIDEVRDVNERQVLLEADIEFTNQVGTDFDHHAFQFLIRVNGEDRWCVIAQETVEDFFALSGSGGHAEAWQAFHENWPLIEAATREAIRNVSIGNDGRIVIGMRELHAARDAARRVTYDPALAPTHRVRFRGEQESWPAARRALYATGRIGMIEMNHEDGNFDVTITTRGPVSRATIYRALRGAGFEILPRTGGSEEPREPGA
ncbi:MAG: hypothetical protein DMF56_12770 [Acidobacteria bacterium]|nr:MAG: hypothetical protein DMF56_12770 [Acidobacteriota bacterium]